MRIQRLNIHNYRSIRDLEMVCSSFVILLGPNNHGKTNLLSALEFFFSSSAKPREEDFFLYRGEEKELWVEITFCELTEQEKNTFKKYITSEDTVCIRKTARITDVGIEVHYNGYVEQPDEEWLRADRAQEYTERESINQTPLKDYVPSSGKLTRNNVIEAQEKYIAEHREDIVFSCSLEENPLFGQKNVAGGILPDFYIFPAVRDLTDEIKIKNTTNFGRLLNRAITEMAERNPHFETARQQVEQVIRTINLRGNGDSGENLLGALEKSIEEHLQSWGVKVSIEIVPPELERLFELGTELHLDDGVKTTAERKGHGLQRAVMLALLISWAKTLRQERDPLQQENPAPRKHSDSVIFAIEEPELFLHPHAQRTLASSLREIAQAKDHQVFICTHSTHFIDLNHYKEIAIISKNSPEEGTRVRQCVEDLFQGNDARERKKRFQMAHWVNPDRSELFFAKKAVFVEGETEKVVLPFLAKKIGVFDSDISVIDCGSKHNLPLYIEVAKAFQIPYLVVHDEDPLPDHIPSDWKEEKRKEKNKTFALNEEIKNLVVAPLGRVEIFSPDFESVAKISKNQGEKKGKALAAIDHFESLDCSQIPERLCEVVRNAFSTSTGGQP